MSSLPVNTKFCVGWTARHLVRPFSSLRAYRVLAEPDVIRMRLKRSDLLGCVEVEGTQVKVVGAAHEPILSCNEFNAAHRHLCHFKRLDESASLVVPDEDVAVVETS